ncbi:MAG TPA: peptidylprolyl isomerase [Polyangiales bacterium]|nr:peptidylprolyl isomerase [Polyangiales bacterium]
MNTRIGLIASLLCCVFVSHAAAAADEACGQIIVVSYKGATAAAPTVTRTKPEAQARAAELLKQAGSGDFAAIARAQSDAPSSAPRGGIMGTYAKAEWPELHAALKAPLFKLKEGQLAKQAIDAPYGYVVLRRCKVEKAHARHLLIRYAGAKNAKSDVTRTRDQAKELAQKLLAGIHSEKDFLDAIARSSEDSSRDRAGDIGSPGRGRLALAFEETLFALKVGERSGVVETEFGFHIIERLPP